MQTFSESEKFSLSNKWKIFLFATLLIGITLRTFYPLDIEYKYDEQYMFAQTQLAGKITPIPLIGMVSGVGVINPGMSIWIFLGLSKLFHATTPPELARSVQILNCLALILLAGIIFTIINYEERIYWLWALCLVCVNPFAILLERKIWAQSTLPFLCTLILLGWLKRDRIWGAFLWGFIGIIIGQIHMSGFFLLITMSVWTYFFSSKINSNLNSHLKSKMKVHWPAFLLGILIGFPFLLPWLKVILQQKFSQPSLPSQSSQPFQLFTVSFSFLSSFIHSNLQRLSKPLHIFDFWSQWITDPVGLGLSYSLGNAGFHQFLRYPEFDGIPTYFVGIIHALIFSMLIFLLYKNIIYWKQKRKEFIYQICHASTESHFLLSMAICCFGLLFSLPGYRIHRHYLIVLFPLTFVWLAQLVYKHIKNSKQAKIVLFTFWICQLLISVSFLQYIHVNHGATNGDYGVGYQFRQNTINIITGRND